MEEHLGALNWFGLGDMAAKPFVLVFFQVLLVDFVEMKKKGHLKVA